MTTYILTEQIMNGTVTMKVITSLVEAETFDGAKEKVKDAIAHLQKLTVDGDTQKLFSYYITGSAHSTHGVMCNEPATFIGGPKPEENIGERTSRLRKERYEGLFWAIRQQVLASGGDGDGLVVSPEYKKLADLFQEYESQEGRGHFTDRGDEEGIARFCGGDDQDCLTFCHPTRERAMAKWAGCDILVRVPYV